MQKRKSLPKAVEISFLLTILTGIVVLLRLAAVARGNLDLAFALAHVSNFAEILLSTLLLMAPTLSVIIGIFWAIPTVSAVRRAIRRPGSESVGSALVWLGTLAVLVAIAELFRPGSQMMLVPALALVWCAVIWVACNWLPVLWRTLGVLRRANGVKPRRLVDPLFATGSALMLTGAFFLLTLAALHLLGRLIPTDQAWSSPEVIYFSDAPPYVARVLSSDSNWTYLLIDNPRSLSVVTTRNVVRRTVCDLDRDASSETSRLWLANGFGTVSLQLTTCTSVLSAEEALYRNHHT